LIQINEKIEPRPLPGIFKEGVLIKKEEITLLLQIRDVVG